MSGKPRPADRRADRPDPVTGDYVGTAGYARRPLPWTYYDEGGGYEQEQQNGTVGTAPQFADEFKLYQQWDDSTGYLVRTGTGSINVAAGKNVVLQERPSVIYTAGERAAPVAGFYAPASVAYSAQPAAISRFVRRATCSPARPHRRCQRAGSLVAAASTSFRACSRPQPIAPMTRPLGTCGSRPSQRVWARSAAATSTSSGRQYPQSRRVDPEHGPRHRQYDARMPTTCAVHHERRRSRACAPSGNIAGGTVLRRRWPR